MITAKDLLKKRKDIIFKRKIEKINYAINSYLEELQNDPAKYENINFIELDINLDKELISYLESLGYTVEDKRLYFEKSIKTSNSF